MRNEWSMINGITERQVKFLEACDKCWLEGQVSVRISANRLVNLKGEDIIEAWKLWGACRRPLVKKSAVEPVKLSEVFSKNRPMKVYRNSCWGLSVEKVLRKLKLKKNTENGWITLAVGAIPEIYDLVVAESSFLYMEGDRLILSTPILSSANALITYVEDDMGFTK